MRLLDEIHLERPFYGSRRLRDELETQGHPVNRKRVQRLMRQMGLSALYPKPRTSQPGAGHKVYPYLLKGLSIERPNQVWASDLSAINTNGAGDPSNVDSATTGTTVPGAPTGLTATANGPSQIDLSWSAPATTGGSAITGYKIEVSPDGSSWSDLVADTASTATTYAHTGLDAGDTRHYRVSAINTNGAGDPSNVDSATTGTTVPGAPTGLTATASGATQIDLSWSAPASTGGSAITGYKIEVSPNGTSGWTDQVANTNSTATTYAHTGLAAGATRHYRVSAINTNGAGDPSNVDSATTGTTVPGAPTGLTATASGTTAINLSWSAPASTGGSAITGYKIEVSPDGSSWSDLVADTASTDTAYAHVGLDPATTRHYRVSAINTNGAGDPSNVDSATTGTTVPGAPTGLTATASGTTAINLSWSAPASTGGSAITGYKIEVSPDGSSWSDLVADTASTATTYAHTGLAAGDTRHYRVSAINTNGAGDPSNVDSATTGTTVPGAPTGLTATASGTTAINLSWSAPASTGGSAITGYKIEVSSNGGSSWTNLVANTSNTTTTYAHTGLTAGATRHYRVSAINANGAGDPSNVANATTGATAPGAPTGLTATASGTTAINLSWTAPGSTGGSAITGYKIEVSPNGTSGWTDQVANTNSTATTYAHTGLGGGTTRHYRVSAINANGAGTASNVDSATTDATAPGAPTGLTATASGTTAINLSWSAPASTGGSAITGYRIEVSPNGTSGWTDQVADTNSTATTYAHTGLAAGDTRHYRVSAINAVGTSDASDSDDTTTASPNTAATGAPTITGTAAVGQPLAVDLTGIADADGLTSPTYTYQWIRVATDNTETNISSATASTYTLVAADQGTTVKVTVSFTDDANNPETRTSAATAAVSAAPNTPATGAPTITGTAQVGQTLTASTTGIADADGLTSPTYTYQWIRVDGTEADIAAANSSTYILVAADLGTTLKVRVTFADDLGHTETLTSAATATVTATPVTTPAAPQRLRSAPGDAQVTLRWAAPASDGGSPILRYEYAVDDSGTWIDAGGDLEETVPGLTNGQSYAVAVRAVNAAGAGPAATVTASPVTTPGAPQRLRSEPGDAQVTLRWEAPTSDGGSPILRYEYAIDDSGTWIDAGDDLEETVPGLTNGQSYAVAVRAVNAAGAGPAATVTASPVTTPGAPQRLRSEPGDAQVTLRWEAPTSDGGSPILRYEYAVDDSGTWIDAGGDLEETVPGLTNGQSYAVAVRAVNAAGAGPAAEVTASPVTTPGAPQRLRSEPGDAQVTLRWEAPTSDGGSPILRYEYAVDDSGTWIDAGGDLEETVPGLTNGQSYAVAVRAVNAAGAGPATTVTASPITTPGAPQRLRSEPGDAQVTLRWEAPTSDGGSPILRYEYAIDGSETWIDAGGDLEETVRDLTSGQSYAVAVRAVNAAGAGPATTVTSVPADPLPQAWLARFGRTATDHVVDAVSSRWHGGPQVSHLTLGGPAEALLGWTGLGGQAARDTAADRGDSVRTERASPRLLAPSGGAGPGVGGTGPGMTVAVTDRTTAPVGLGGVDRHAGAPLRGRAAGRALLGAWGVPDPTALTDLRAALLGSSFLYAGAQDDDGQTRTPGWLGAWSAWGRGAASWFSGADGGASLEGEVATAMLGVDSRWGRWRAGVVASHSRGQGTYTPSTAPGGAVASTLTALHPYAGYDVNARTSVWGVVGYGVGEVSLTPARATTARETDLTNTMAAVGGRTALSVRSGRAGRFELALRSDARLTNTAADAVAGLVGATERTRLVRMMLEGAGVVPLALGGVLTPTVEAGLRYDTGDAETGAGLEVGGGLGYAARRLSVTVNARGLLAHQDTAYEEWGFSGALTVTPSADGRGLSMRLGSGWGATHSGVESLWSRQNAAALVRHAPVDAAQAYQLEVRYGLDGRQGRARWAPYLGVASGGGSRQALRLGVTLTVGRRLDAGLELGQRQGAPGADPERAAQLRATLRW